MLLDVVFGNEVGNIGLSGLRVGAALNGSVYKMLDTILESSVNEGFSLRLFFPSRKLVEC
jgi:hypothetical protein